MSKAILYLDKYSDWLEATSVFEYDNSITEAIIYFIENERNDLLSVKGLFEDLYRSRNLKLSYKSFTNNSYFSESLLQILPELCSGDYILAPFIRYRTLWNLIPKIPKGIKTIQLSEGFSDTFGPIGYRLGFRYNSTTGIKKLFLPLWWLYAKTHKPDISFFPFKKSIANPFVKITIPAYLPNLTESKKEFFERNIGNDKRVLFIGGFGFSVKRMADFFKTEKYIATSKFKEINIDGTVYPLEERICAEEVLLSGKVSKIIGYNSTVMIWAKMYFPDVEIICYASTQLNRQYGKYFEKYSKSSLKAIGVDLLPEDENLLEK